MNPSKVPTSARVSCLENQHPQPQRKRNRNYFSVPLFLSLCFFSFLFNLRSALEKMRVTQWLRESFGRRSRATKEP